jgi:hypothetical protein
MNLPVGRLPVALALAALVAGFHVIFGARLAHSVLLEGFNWLFDFDASRLLPGWCAAGADIHDDLSPNFIARHPLALAVRPLGLAVTAVWGDPGAALMVLTALCAGGAAALAYHLAALCCPREFDRVLLSLGFSAAAQPLVLGIVPETYGFALLGIGAHFFWLARAQGPLSGWISALSLFINLGVTITNAALNWLSSVILAWGRTPLRIWLRDELKRALWVIAALLVLTLALAALFVPNSLNEVAKVPKLLWWTVNINRGEPASALTVAATLLVYNVVAPLAEFVQLPPPESHPMLDYRGWHFSAIGMLAVALWCAALAASTFIVARQAAQRRLLFVAWAWLLLNILLHAYWQFRGSIFIYGGHTVFALFLIAALGYGQALKQWRPSLVRLYALVMVACIAGSNWTSYAYVIDFVVGHSTTR